MTIEYGVPEMEEWIGSVRRRVSQTNASLLEIFEIYAAEAMFGRSFIDSDLACLKKGSKVLEIGAGAILLSCQLVREGYTVSALEPTGEGYSHLNELRRIVFEHAKQLGCVPRLLNLPAEQLNEVGLYDYAFSINVMEHVANVRGVLERVGESLRIGADYRFTCPNYIFPYEPHFNIPTFFSKRLTERFLREKIFANKSVPDPLGTWESLNWINTRQVSALVSSLPSLYIVFGRSLLVTTLARIVSDPSFASRRSPFLRGMLRILVYLRLHSLFVLVPPMLQPVMDCRVKKLSRN